MTNEMKLIAEALEYAIQLIESEWGICPQSIIDAYIAAGGNYEDI